MDVANYSKLFTVADPITHKPLTILVEAFTPLGGETVLMIKTLEGEYETQKEFKYARNYVLQGLELAYHRAKLGKVEQVEEVLHDEICLYLRGFLQLAEAVDEAVKAMEQASRAPVVQRMIDRERELDRLRDSAPGR